MRNHSKKMLDQTISAYIGKLFKDMAGKGPENVYVALGDRYFVVYIKNYMMPYEKIIQEDGDMDLLYKVMHITMKKLNSKIVQYTEIVTGISTEESYYDWNIENGSRVLVGISHEPYDTEASFRAEYHGKQLIHKELIKLGHYVDSIPEEICSCNLNSKILIFERSGGITRLEKEMAQAGHGDVIKNTKRQLEKKYLNNNLSIKNVLDIEVADSFIDWNFQDDKSIVVIAKAT